MLSFLHQNFKRPHLKKSPPPLSEKNICYGQRPPSDCGRLLWTAPFLDINTQNLIPSKQFLLTQPQVDGT